MLPWVHACPQPKQHLSRFSHFFHSSRHGVVGHVRVCSFPEKFPPRKRRSGPHLIHVFAYPSSQLKRHLDRFSRFCTAHRTASLYFSPGRPSPSPLKMPIPMVRPHSLNLYLTHDSLLQSELTTQTASRVVQPFLQGSRL